MIESEELEFPIDVENEEIKSLIKRLLNKAPESRVKGDIGELMADKFFDGFDWSSLITEEMEAPYIPDLDPIEHNEENISIEKKIQVPFLYNFYRRKEILI